MFDLNIRLQIAAILIFIVLFVDFIRNKKIPLLSTRLFFIILIFCGINLIFDITTVYTITNLDKVNPIVNRFFHQLFIGSLDFVIFFLYLYVDTLGKKEKRFSINIKNTFKMIPIFLSIVIVIFAPLYYYNDGTYAYSYGPMTYTVYISVAIYMIMSIIDTFIYRKIISKENIFSIRLGISIWVISTVIQLFFPKILLSGLSLIIMFVILYFSFENPKEHLDEETKTFNKTIFLNYLNERFYSKKTYSLISVVIEGLSSINTTYGYETGSKVLRCISEEMNINKKVFAFHPSGNVITLIVLDKSNDYQIIVSKLKKFLDEPITIENEAFPISAHIDIIKSIDIKDYSPSKIINTIMFMSSSTSSTENNTLIVYYDDKIKESQNRYITIEQMINNAIINDGFEMVYQPIYNTKDKIYSSAEALVRLKDTKTIGFVSPDEFIRISEKNGTIHQIGDIILDMVCKFISEYNLEKTSLKYIEVNLSAIQCSDALLPLKVKNVIEKYKIKPSFINLEITETAYTESSELLSNNIKELIDYGCSFSMDDFGTGYSNLSKISTTNYKLIKIDKSLIWPCFDSKIDSSKPFAILKNVLNMLNDLNIDIVAEGVETKEQEDYLILNNTKYIQGYYHSKPLKVNDFIDFIKK